MWTRTHADCAAAAPLPTTVPTIAEQLLPTTSSTSTTTTSTTTTTTPITPPSPPRAYPGMFSDMSGMAGMILRPDVFDGCRFEIAKGFNEKFAVTHSLLLGSAFLPPPSGRVYQFGTTYTPTATTMLMGRLNPGDGSVKMIGQGLMSDRLTLKANCDLNRSGAAEPVPSSGVFNLQFRGDDYSLGLQSQIVEGDAPSMKFSFLQSLTTKLCAGAEGTYRGAKAEAHVSVGARYAGADYMATSNYSFMQNNLKGYKISAHYMKKVDPKVSLAASLECVPVNNQAAVSLGYIFNLQTAKVQATVKSNWEMHATLEEHIAPGFSLLFSGILDHTKETYKFGVGLSVGQ